MAIKLTIIAAALFALSAPASAESWPQRPKHAHAHRSKPHYSDSWNNSGQSGGYSENCPSRDCNGVNSPGFMGGNKPF